MLEVPAMQDIFRSRLRHEEAARFCFSDIGFGESVFTWLALELVIASTERSLVPTGGTGIWWESLSKRPHNAQR
jgi:hypothetical protein